jgi:predicted ABC-type ATPase
MKEIEFDYTPSGPEIEKADNYETTFCGDLECGLHIFSYRKDGTIICETTLSAKATLDLVEYCKKHLYQKATRRS